MTRDITRRPSLRGAAIVVMVGAIAVIASSAFFLYRHVEAHNAADAKVSLEVQEITAYYDARSAVAYEGEYLAAYLLLRDEQYLELYGQQRDAADTAFSNARTLLTAQGDSDEVSALDKMAALHASVNDAEERGLEAVARGDALGALSIAAQTDLLDSTTQLTIQLNTAVAAARTHVAQARRDNANAQTRLTYALTGVSIVWCVVLLLIGWVTLRWLVRPLEQVRRASEAIAGGQLDQRVPTAGPYELVRVGRSVNGMADALIRRSEELNAYLSRNLEARTRELEASNIALEESETRFRSMVQHAADLITVVAPDLTIAYQIPAIERLLGVDAQSVVGDRISALVHPGDWPQMLDFFAETTAGAHAVRAVEVRLRHADGSWRHVEIVGSDRRLESAIGGFVLNMRDVSERKALEDQLRRQAFEDPLTGLANRARFNDRLEHALQRATRTGSGVAVLFLDLDNFKGINDTLGHAAGDRLLIEVGKRLKASAREGDTTARLGGDEFAVLLEDAGAANVAVHTAQRIIDALRQACTIDGTDVATRASIGIAAASDNSTTADELLRNADVAVYFAKGHGKGRYDVYDESMRASMIDRLELIGDLEFAVARGEFVIHYQPTIELSNGRVVGAEALLRWQHPRRGMIEPADFIPLAEESGAILELGRWVLREACRQASRWQTTHTGPGVFSMSVNVSARQLADPAFVSDVAAILTDAAVDPAGVVLEITESVMMGDAGATTSVLSALKDLGIRLAIDDFGTGYSSLSYLRQFPFDILKIDKSFVGDDATTHDPQLERAIIDLGRTLKLQIIAEGIERPEQLARLRELTCDFGQGYLFARPLPADDMDRLLMSKRSASRAA